MHYHRWQRHGDPEKRAVLRGVPAIERFWAKVDKTNGPVISRRLGRCWLWTGAKHPRGYGSFDSRPAHVFSYILANGPVPPGLELDHLCRTTSCVRPSHLEAVTHRENTRRGDTVPARNARKTECLRGHAYTSENTYRYPDGRRGCRTCRYAAHHPT